MLEVLPSSPSSASPGRSSRGADLQAPARPAAASPLETARNAEKGSLKSPYADYASVAEEGHQKYMAAGCNGCHGGGGGGGMGPPLTNEVWVYGKDDDTLFRLIALGSDELQKQGYSRKGSENVVGPMPAHGNHRQIGRRSVEDHRLDQVGEPVFRGWLRRISRPVSPVAGGAHSSGSPSLRPITALTDPSFRWRKARPP